MKCLVERGILHREHTFRALAHPARDGIPMAGPRLQRAEDEEIDGALEQGQRGVAHEGLDVRDLEMVPLTT